VLYFNSEKTAVNIQKEATLKGITQVNYNIDFLTQVVRHLGNNIYDDVAIKVLRYANNRTDPILYVNGIYKLDALVDSSVYLDSIVVYSGETGAFHIGNQKARTEPKKIVDYFSTLLSNPDNIPSNRLFPVELDPTGRGKPKEIDLFSFVYFERDIHNKVSAALILNIKKQWLLDNIKEFSKSGERNEMGYISLIDSAGQVITSSGLLLEADSQPYAAVRKRISESGVRSGSFTSKHNGNRELIYYDENTANRWSVVHVQRYQAILSGILVMRLVSIIITISMLLIAVTAAIFVSKRLYRPVEGMLAQIRRGDDTNPNDADKDEFKFVANAYKEVIGKLTHARQDVYGQQEIVRNYHLRKLVLESHLMKPLEYQQLIKKNQLSIGEAGFYRIVLMKIDSYTTYEKQASHMDKRTFSFAVTNIAQEIMSGMYRCETVDMKYDHFVSVLHTNNRSDQDDKDELEQRIAKVQTTISEFYKQSLTVSVSKSFDDYRELSTHYETALHNTMYKMIKGNQAVIFVEAVKTNEENAEISLPLDVEKAFIEALFKGNKEEAHWLLSSIFLQISRMNVDYMVYTVLHIVVSIKNAMKETSSSARQRAAVDMYLTNRKLMVTETLEEMENMFRTYINELTELQEESVPDVRNDVLTETIKEIVELRYTDFNLSVNTLADLLKMSSAYVSRVFRKSNAISLAEYISDVRLKYADELLANTDLTVMEIMEKTGFGSKSQFHKLFKQKHHMTPKEYRLNLLRDYR
jgi:AraC-like DNA-binding protein